MNSIETKLHPSRNESPRRRSYARWLALLVVTMTVLQVFIPGMVIAQGADTTTALVVTYSPPTTRNDALIQQTDVNYYKFNVSSNDTVEVTVTATSNSGLAGVVEMFDKTGGGYFPGSYYFFDGRPGHILVPLTPGRYYIKVHTYSYYSNFPASILPSGSAPPTGVTAQSAAPPPISFKITQPDSGTYRLVLRRASTSKPYVGYSFAGMATGTNALISMYALPGNLPTNVSIDYGVSPGFGTVVPYPSNPLAASFYGTGGPFPLSGLTPGTSYTYRLIALNSAGGDTCVKYYPYSPFSFDTPPLVSDWAVQTISGMGSNAVAGVALGSATKGIACGPYGVMLRTTNGGTTWIPVSTGVSTYFNAADMLDSLKGVAVGQAGAVAYTTDGGNSWTPGASGTGAYLYSVTYANATTVFAVGESGLILKSTNGGSTWATQTSGTTNYLYTVRFVDVNNGMAVGDGGRILRTTNGGTNWTTQTSGTGAPIYTCWMFDASNAIAPLYYGSDQLRTTNGGTTWTMESGVTSPANSIRAMSFYDAVNGVFTNWDGTIFRTTNRGATWYQMETGLRGALYAVDAKSYSKVVAAGEFGTVLIALLVPPAAPKNLAAQAGDLKAYLQWNANTELDFTRYRIYMGTSPNPTVKIDSTTAGLSDTTRTINGLTNGTTYYFRVTAVDQGGLESSYSNQVSIVPRAVPTVTNFAPTSGRIGTSVVLTGTGFDLTPSNNGVYFGGVKAIVTNATATTLTVAVPPGTSYAPITVTVNGLTAFSNKSFATTFYADRSIKSTSFAPKVDYPSGSAPFGMAVGDLDGSGKPDIVVANFTSNTASIFRNTMSGGPYTVKSLGVRIDLSTGLNPQGLAIGDVDGDGKLDLVVANNGSSTVSVFRNSGSVGNVSMPSRVDFAVGSQPASVALRDIDGDGRPDIITTNNGTDSVSVLRNLSSPGAITVSSFSSHVDFNAGSSPNGLAVGDVDGDGKPDIVVTNQSSQTISVLRNTSTAGVIGAGSFAARVTATVGNQPATAALVDLDGNGALDVVTANLLGNSVSVLRNTSSVGSVSFAAASSISVGSNPYAVTAADLDGDGSPDLVTANQSGTATVLKNTSTVGAISFSSGVNFTGGSTPDGLAVADLEGSGKPSICLANSGSASISLLKNMAPYTEIAGNNTVSTAMPMAYGDSVDALLAPSGEVDYFSFSSAAGDSALIVVTPLGPYTLRASGIVYDSAGGTWSYSEVATSGRCYMALGSYNTRTYYVRYASWNSSTSFPSSMLPGPKDAPAADNVPQRPNLNMATAYADTGSYRISIRRFTPGAPDIMNLYMPSIYSNSAVMAAQVVTNGDSTTVKFDYGTTTSYGTTISSPGLGGRFDWYQSYAFAPITGLTPNTTYHFRCTVTNAFGSYTSEDRQFTTPDVPTGWMNVAVSSYSHLNDVSFPTAATGYAVGGNYQINGEYATLLKTVNGGITWTKMPNTWNYGPSSVSFVDASTGLVADYMYILKTTDGGTSWTNTTPSNTTYLAAVQFISPTRAFAVGNNGTVLKSTNGGTTWSTPLPTGTTNLLRACYFADQFNGWIAGDAGTILQTTDGGTSWTNYTNASYGYFNSIWFVNATTGFAVAGNSIIKTTDAGATWSPIPSTYGSYLQDVRFYTDQKRGAAVGGNGTIWLTNDSGSTWASQKTGTSNWLRAVAFNNASVVTAVGEFGTILHRDTVGTAPSVATNAASAITTVSAALNATVNPGGLSTQAWFQYGTTPGVYSFTTSLIAVGSGTLGLAYADTLKSLTPNTTFYYRIAAQNLLGSNYGSESSFKTQPLVAPTAPSGLIATGVSSQDVDLTWTDNSDNELGFRVQRRLGGSVQPFSTIDSVRTNITTYSDHNLTPATTYVYRVFATNAIGPSGFSNADSANTQPTPTAPPTPPSNLVATMRDTSRIDLTWTSNSDNELKFLIEQGNTGSGPWVLVDSTGPKVTARTRTGLTPGRTYYFRVRASNQAGYSGYTNTAQATTQALLPLASLASTKVNFGNVEAAFATKDSLLSLTNNGAATLNIASITLTDATQFSIVTGFQAGALAPGQSRTIRVRFQPTTIGSKTTYMKVVSDDVSQGSPPGTLTDTLIGSGVNTRPPAKPTGTAINPSSWSNVPQFTLSWTDPGDPAGIDSMWYKIDAPPTAGSPGTITVVTANSGVVTVPTEGTHWVYYYLQNGSGFKSTANYDSIQARYDATVPVLTVDTASVPTVTVQGGSASPAVNVSASATDAGGSTMKAMLLQYRRTGDVTPPDSASYSAPFGTPSTQPIPLAKFVVNSTAAGVDYRVIARDFAGNAGSSPWFSVRVQNASGVTVAMGTTFPAASSDPGNEVKAYRIFSVPYDLQDKRPSGFVPASLGNHDEQGVSYVRWKMVRWVGGAYEDYDAFKDDATAAKPGAGFFLAVRDPNLKISISNTVSAIVPAAKMYTTGIPLASGWNLVGDPLTVPVAFDSLTFTGGIIQDHAYYTGNGPVGGWEKNSTNANTLSPWQGLAIRVSAAGSLKFHVIAPAPELKGGGATAHPSLALVAPKSAEGDWRVGIDAVREDNGMRNIGNAVGMAANAKDGYDRMDSFQPPFVGAKNVAVYFQNPDGAMMEDIRTTSAEGQVWPMTVVTGDRGARLNLRFSGARALPNAAFDAFLIDDDQKMAHNLKEVSDVSLNSGDGTRNLRLVIGTRKFLLANQGGVEVFPSKMQLYANYPNPFNPSTVIRYAVPGVAPRYRVTLKVFNLLGQEVATLVNGEQTNGYYEVTFDGRSVSSGVYFYRVTMNGEGDKMLTDIKKMILLK